mmetsp:Transcript_7768/g.16633  ORF Transcript_7768/g.16633 Transcript_7768/m.16633 type:complete len:131 (-) Transcript_7768:1004-1396(-)
MITHTHTCSLLVGIGPNRKDKYNMERQVLRQPTEAQVGLSEGLISERRGAGSDGGEEQCVLRERAWGRAGKEWWTWGGGGGAECERAGRCRWCCCCSVEHGADGVDVGLEFEAEEADGPVVAAEREGGGA